MLVSLVFPNGVEIWGNQRRTLVAPPGTFKDQLLPDLSLKLWVNSYESDGLNAVSKILPRERVKIMRK